VGGKNVLSQPIFPPNGVDVLVPYYGAQLAQACSGCSGTSQVAQTAQVSRVRADLATLLHLLFFSQNRKMMNRDFFNGHILYGKHT
jgi:hypothetical protein